MPPVTVGEIFAEKRPAVGATATVSEALDAVRTSQTDQTVYYVYVVEGAGTLAGVTSVRELLNAADDQPVSAVATDEVVSIRDCDPIEYAATVFVENDFMALPVVDNSDELLGILRPNSVIEALDGGDPVEVLADLLPEGESASDELVAYECFSCKTTVTAEENPEQCPNCGGELRANHVE